MKYNVQKLENFITNVDAGCNPKCLPGSTSTKWNKFYFWEDQLRIAKKINAYELLVCLA